MQQEVKRDILEIINGTIEILAIPEPQDVSQLKELSNHTIHDASIYQDEFSIGIAILTYALYKLLERGCKCTPGQYQGIINNFKSAKAALEQDKEDEYQAALKNIIKTIKQLDEKFKVYIQEVLDKAKITKGSKLFAHGLSIGMVSKLLDIGQWELRNYVGKTEIIEQTPGGMSQRKRLELALDFFNA